MNMKKFLTVLILCLAAFAVSCSDDESGTEPLKTASITAATLSFSDANNFAWTGSLAIADDGSLTVTTFKVVYDKTTAGVDTSYSVVEGLIKSAIEVECTGVTATVAFDTLSGAIDDTTNEASAAVTVTLKASSGYELSSTITEKSPTFTMIVAGK